MEVPIVVKLNTSQKKYREVEFFGLLPPKPIYMGQYSVIGIAPDCKFGA